MNKKGFTLIELILVITLMAIISIIVVPNILDSLDTSTKQKYESMYKLVEKNMKYYNDKNEVDLWNDTNFIDLCNGSTDCSEGIDTLEKSGSDLELDNCSITTMTIEKNDDRYNYNLVMICGDKDKVTCTKDENGKVVCE